MKPVRKVSVKTLISNGFKENIRLAYNNRFKKGVPSDVFRSIIHSQYKFSVLVINNGEGINLKGFGRVGQDKALQLAISKYIEMKATASMEELRDMFSFILGNKNVFNNVNTFSLRKAADENGNPIAITDAAALDKSYYKPYLTIEEIIAL